MEEFPNESIASTYSFSDSREEDALTARHKKNPDKAFELYEVLKVLGLASRVFETQVVKKKRRIVQEGTKMIVNDLRFTGHSFKLFTVDHPLRVASIRIVTHSRYNNVTAMLYFLSSVTLLARSDSKHRFPDDTWSAGVYFATMLDRVLLLLFTIDLMLSFVAHGLLKCLRQWPPLLDTCMIVSSIGQEFFDQDSILSTIFFAISSLRPVRIVSRMKSMMRLLGILGDCTTKLLHVAMLIMGICIMFGIAAVILFRDAAHTRCVNILDPSDVQSACSASITADNMNFLYTPCPDGYVCRAGQPNLAAHYSYDNIGNAILLMFQILTLDNWTVLAVDMMNALSPAAGVFYVLATFLLAFWATNQFTAVIFDSFSTTFTEEQKRIRPQGGNDAPKRKFISKGTAPQAQRTVQKMKQEIATQSVKSITTGIRSLKAADYLSNEIRRTAEKKEDTTRKKAENDFFLDDKGIDAAFLEQYKYQQLESFLKPDDQKMLEAVKGCQFRDDKERNLILNVFHSMSDAARTKCYDLLRWRAEIPLVVNNGATDDMWHDVSEAKHSMVSTGGGYQPPSFVPYFLNAQQEEEDEKKRCEEEASELWSEIDRHSMSSQRGIHHDMGMVVGTISNVIQKGGNLFRRDRGRKAMISRGEATVLEHLDHLREEHKKLWREISSVFDDVRKKRAERKMRMEHRINILNSPAKQSSPGRSMEAPLLSSGDSEASVRSSDSTSSATSSDDTVDTIDRIVRLHQRIEMQDKSLTIQSSPLLLKTMHPAQRRAIIPPAARSKWKTAKSLDEALGLDLQSATLNKDESAKSDVAVAHSSVFDRSTSLEDYRLANGLLYRILREYNEFRVLERPQPTQWELFVNFIESLPIRVYMYQLLRSPLYDRIVLYTVLLNCALMGFVHYDQPQGFTTFLNGFSLFVDFVIVFDTVMRIVLTSFATYFFLTRRNLYNLVEFLVTFLCMLDLVLVPSGFVPALKNFRVLRAMKFMKQFTLLRQILLLCRTSLGYLINLLLLQIIVWMVFTYSGRQLFGNSFRSDDLLRSCNQFSDSASCNTSPDCIWVSQDEWMVWNNTYILLLKQHARSITTSVVASLSLLPAFTSTRDISTTQSTLSATMSQSSDKSHSYSASQSFSITLQANSTLPDSVIDPRIPSPVQAPVQVLRRCRQFQNWNAINPFDRFSFESLTMAFLTVYDVVTKDNWSTIQYNFMNKSGASASLFFLALLVIGGYLILSLLVAVLLVNFEQKDEVVIDSIEEDVELFDQEVLVSRAADPTIRRIALERISESLQLRDVEAKRREKEAADKIEALQAREKEKEELERLLHKAEVEEMKKRSESLLPGAVGTVAAAEGKPAESVGSKQLPRWSRILGQMTAFFTLSPESKSSWWYRAWTDVSDFFANFCDAENEKIHVVEGKSLNIFRPSNPVRQFAVRFVRGEFFALEKTVFWLTLLHCFVTPATPKLIDTVPLLISFHVMDWFLSIFAFAELLLRFVAMGVFQGKYTYFMTYGLAGAADVSIVVSSFLSLIVPLIISAATGGAYDGTAIGFALKSFRPFRAVSRSGTMKSVVIAVWRTVPELVNILGLSLVIYLMFSVMCVEAFKGRLRTCNDGSDRSREECVGLWIADASTALEMIPLNATSMVAQRQWSNAWFHFDDCFNAFNTLFTVSLVSGWSQTMFAMIDAPAEAGQSPQRNFDLTSAGWLVFWAIFSNSFLINIFVGSIVDRFSKLKDELQGNAFISAEQYENAKIKKSLVTKTAKKVLRLPEVPFISKDLNSFCFRVVTHPYFLNLIKGLLLLNAAIILTLHYQQTKIWSKLQLYGNIAISVIFAVEAMLKIGVGGLELYFTITFHYVEAAVVVEAVIEAIYAAVNADPPPFVQILQLIRIVRLVRDAKEIRRILHTGYKALPAMGNIGAVLIAVLFTFSMISISLFGDVRYDLTGSWFSPMFSLRTVPKAMFTLYTVSTLDNWGQVLSIAGVSPPNCVGSDCGSWIVAGAFFNIFVITVALIMLNLFMAIVLENFSDAVLLPHYLEERKKDVEAFRHAWTRFDNGRNVIQAAAMIPLLQSLPGPQERFQQMKDRRDNAADDDSIHSIQSEEIRVYAETQTIGLGGCPHGSVIPTVQQLKLVVTMPQEEILYLDAISAVGEKIYCTNLVDERVRRAYSKMLHDADETQIPFSKWYATVRFQRLFRERAKEQAQYQSYIADRDAALTLNKDVKLPFLVPRHVCSGSSLWDAVLDPIVGPFVKQHFRAAWTLDNKNTKMRQFTLSKRTIDEDDLEDEEMKQQRQAILEQAERRQAKSLAATIKERQVEVEEAPEVAEDTSWMEAVEWEDDDPFGGMHNGDLTQTRQTDLRIDPETGAVSHIASLDEVITKKRKDLLFQIKAQNYRRGRFPTAAQLKEFSSMTTVELRKVLDGEELHLDVWTAGLLRWAHTAPSAWALTPPNSWRVELSFPLETRQLLVPRKKRAPQSQAHVVKNALVEDWSVLYRIQEQRMWDFVSFVCSQASAQPVPATAQASNVPSADLAAPLSPTTERRPTEITPTLHKLPTLRERMESMGLTTTFMRQREAEEEAERQAEARRQQTNQKGLALESFSKEKDIGQYSGLFTVAPHSDFAMSVRLITEEGVELSPVAAALYKEQHGDVVKSIGSMRITTSNTAGSYDLPHEKGEDVASRLSFSVLTRLCMAARRFKKRKAEEAVFNMRRRSVSRHTAASSYSRSSFPEDTSEQPSHHQGSVSDPQPKRNAKLSFDSMKESFLQGRRKSVMQSGGETAQ